MRGTAGRRADPLAVVAQDRDADVGDDSLRGLDALDLLDAFEDRGLEARPAGPASNGSSTDLALPHRDVDALVDLAEEVVERAVDRLR